MNKTAAMEQPRLRQAKYFRPPPRKDRVGRQELLRQLDEAAGSRVLLVTAAAGYGKTTLVSDWIESRRLHHAWLGLDEHADGITFWRELITSIQALCPGAGHTALEVLKSGQPGRIAECPALLSADLAETAGSSSERRCVVIDDYHLIADEIADESLAALAQQLPAGWQLLVIARTLPAIPLARLRAAGEVTQIEQAQLRFSAIESAEFVRRCAQLELDDNDLALLLEKTEGWAAGLQLATLSMRNVDDHHGFIAGLGGDSRAIEEYLTEEVLRSLPADLQLFLDLLAPLERFCESLCVSLLGHVAALRGRNARSMLDQLETLNLFLVPLDQRRDWYRFHHLFRDLLLRRSESGVDRELGLRIAATWLEDHGHLDEALALALQLGEPHWCERLLLLGAGLRQPYEMREWLRRLPDSYIAQSPALIYIGISIGLQTGQPREAQYWLRLLTRLRESDARLSDDPGLNVELDCYALVANAWVDISMHDASSSSAGADRIAEYIEQMPASALAGLGRLHLVHSELLFQSARLDEAIAAASRSVDIATIMSMGRIIGASCNRVGECYALQGRLRELQTSVDEGIRVLDETLAADQLTASGYLEKLQCEALVERFELDEACERLLRLRERAQRESHHYLDQASGLLLAVATRSKGQHEYCRKLASQLVRLSQEYLIRLWFMPTPGATWARASLDLGDAKAARDWANAAGLEVDRNFDHLREYEYLVLVRILAAEDDLPAAAALAKRIRDQAHAGGRRRIELEAAILEAVAMKRQGDTGLEALSDALEIGAREGYIQPFLDESDTLPGLLRDAARRGIERHHLERIETIAGKRKSYDSQVLSPREIDVLLLMASGQPNKNIASELHLSPNTIKTHTRHIYEKLGVANRTQAVARATVIGLL